MTRRGRATVMARISQAGVALLAVAAVASCGGSKISDGAKATGAAGGKDCGTVNLAVNNWVGYEANAAVIAEVLKTELGCTVVKKDLKEDVSWQGFGSGEVDAIVENWGHDDLKKLYIDGIRTKGDKDLPADAALQTAVDAGLTGNKGVIGWFVPPWMKSKYPDILDYKNLNKYASLFKTTESGAQGQFLAGDKAYVTNDEALVKNLKLNYKVVYSGSEAALITAFRQAEAKKTPLIGYFYAPQWFLSEVALDHVKLPPYTEGCDADPAKVACDYPAYDLNKIIGKKFSESGSPAVDMIKKFQWTNDDQNLVAKYIAEDKMTAEDAAKKWIAENPDKVKAWIS